MKLHLSFGRAAWRRAFCAVSLAAGCLVGDASAQWCGPRCVPCNPAPYSGRPTANPGFGTSDNSGPPQSRQLTPAESILGAPSDSGMGMPGDSAGGANPNDLMSAPAVDSSSSLGQPSANDFAMDSGIGGGVAGDVNAGGYIDQAIIANRVRLRYDNVQRGNTDFAEFLYGAYGLNGKPQIQNYDYNEGSLYLEYMLTCNLSIFVDTPFRAAVYDDFNFNGGLGDRTRESGIADMNAGLRYGLINDGCSFVTAQLKAFIPTGNTQDGLGTGHASLQPGLLFQRDFDRLHIFGEVHDWISLGDTRVGNGGANNDPNTGRFYGGNVLRYGLGSAYDIARNCDKKLQLVGEVVGWTCAYGYKSVGPGAGGGGGGGGLALPLTDNAAGDTIVNFKGGVRYTQGYHSLYVGYGFPITQLELYQSIIRADYTYAGW